MKYKSWKIGAAVLAGLALGACASPGVVADISDADAPAYVVQAAPEDLPSDTVPSEPTPASIFPSLDSLVVNGVDLSGEGDVFTFPVEVNPGDRLEIAAKVNDDVDGTIRALTTVRPYKESLGTVKFSLTIPSDLSSVDIPLIIEGKDGESVEYTLRIEPSSAWAPSIVIENPTGLTGEVSLEARVFDLNGTETAELIGVEQEFNFQDTGNKEIDEYISNNSLAPIEIEQTESGLYVVTFSTEWPGRFPLHFTAVDENGNETVSRVPVVVKPLQKVVDIEGMAISAYWDANFDYRPVLDKLVENNVQAIQLNPIWYMPTKTSTEIRPWAEKWQDGNGGVTISDENIHKLIREANSKGLDIFLKPMIEFDNWIGWRGDLNPTNWDDWFNSYTKFITHYAKIAEEENVPLFSVGAELRNANRYTAQWKEVIEQVREVYSGEITYSDSETLSGQSFVQFWDDLDYIGAVVYYPSNGTFWGSSSILKDPTVEEITESVANNFDRIVTPLAERYSMEVIVTETGVPNQDGSSVQPWVFTPTEGAGLDHQEQTNFYEAVFRVLSKRDFVKGIFWWETVLNKSHSPGESLATYDPWGRPAEDVIKIWYDEPDTK